MTFRVAKRGRTLYSLARDAGYRPLSQTPQGEYNCVRPLGGDYPRFHVYLKEDGDAVIVNLHLDQKRPSYGGETAHSGDYQSDVVKNEAARVKEALAREG